MQELADKFYLPSEVMESRNFNKKIKEGTKNPFESKENIQICSYHFARNKADYLQLVSWDLIVIDEAHYLRNVYRGSNKIATEIRNAILPFKKILLTATPLQNKIEELYGLVSFIDDSVFGDLKSFKRQFLRTEGGIDFDDLRERVRQVCHRTLRRQVTEYINYKQRIPITETFIPSEKEQELYEKVTEYLQRETNFALPPAQKHLMTSVLRKLLASSSYAISGTLESLIKRLKKLIKGKEIVLDEFIDEIDEDYELFDEDIEEWDEDLDDVDNTELSKEDILSIQNEIADLEDFLKLANSIQHNVKGEKLKVALDKGFAKLSELGAKPKAIIFTESVRTQHYLFEVLEQTEFKGKIVLFNGSNNDEKSKELYHNWVNNKKNKGKVTGSRTVDIRAAIVDTFKDEDHQIMIATEAAAEGINLQFCSMVVNYDLPWNPQRIEQRIGRCHRYGQEFDVVVINFLNATNETDQRVFQLLEQKFHLFSGVFGASDEVLGSITSGVDFEKRLTDIYKHCRTKEQITKAFDLLQEEFKDQIDSKVKKTQEQLFQNFDAQVVQKLKTTENAIKIYITKYEQWLWKITKFLLQEIASFDDRSLSFHLKKTSLKIEEGTYSLDKKREDAIHYRLGHRLAQNLIEKGKKLDTPLAKISFNYSASNLNNAEDLDLIVFAGATDKNEVLKDEICQFLLTLPSTLDGYIDTINQNKIEKYYALQKQKHLDFVKQTDTNLLKNEIQKFEKWANDRITGSEQELKDVKKKIQELERGTRQEGINADDLLEIQKKIRALDRKKSKLRREIFDVEDQILAERDDMIEEAEGKLNRTTTEQEIFTIEWELT